MKTLLLLSVLFILMVACGQSATPEPTNEPPRTEPTNRPTRTKSDIQSAPTTAVEERLPTKSSTISQAGDKQESVPSPTITPSRRLQDPPESTPDQSDEQVVVSIYLIGNGHEEKIVEFIKSNGGDPRNVSAGYIEAYVPVRLLAGLSERPEVGRVQKIIPPEPN